MTIGTAIFLSTTLLVVAFAIHQISKHGKWMAISKWAAGFSAVVALAVIGFVQWDSYDRRPQPPQPEDTLHGVRLGMSAVDVKLAKGLPEFVSDDGHLWNFHPDRELTVAVMFDDSPPESKVVKAVCADTSRSIVLGVTSFDSEDAIVRRLGSPSSTSIAGSGLSKYISYKSYNAAFELEKGRVKEVCITSEGAMTYGKGYKLGTVP